MARLARGLPQKQDGIKIVTKIPSSSDGKAGDMRLLSTSSVEGAVLYVKSGNKWFPFQSGLDTSGPAKKLFETDGYQILDSGLIIQWGYVTANATTKSVTFPIAFPSECLSITCTDYASGDTTGITSATGISVSPTTTTVVFTCYNVIDNFYWMAIGH